MRKVWKVQKTPTQLANGRYILKNGRAVLEPNLFKWGAWMQTANRQVAKASIGKVLVSTVFLGLDHSFGIGKPVLWETMVFGGNHGGLQVRYSSRAAALRSHQRIIKMILTPAHRGSKTLGHGEAGG